MVSMMGSALGAVICFLLGRYMMRDMVKKWIRKYPIFDAIDIAATEHGLRIMAMLYLTPILPLGPVSYMCGTTSLKLSHFIIAKIAALPLMMLYVLIGASTGTLIGTGTTTTTTATTSSLASDSLPTDHSPNDTAQSIESNETLIISGILLSFASIAGITHYIKKELNHILERQKRELEQNGIGSVSGSSSTGTASTSSTTGIEFSHMATSSSVLLSSGGKDVESGGSTAGLGSHLFPFTDGNTSTTAAITAMSKVTPPSSSGVTTRGIESDDAVPITSTASTTATSASTTMSTNTAPRQRKH
jgi:hypothetical protein